MPKPKRQATQGPFQGSTTFALAQLPTALLPTIVACLDAPARKAAALASRELHAAVAPLWSTAAFTLSDSADAPDPKPADVSWLFQRLPGLHSLRIVSDLHAFGWGLDDGMALLAAALQARPPPFRLRSFSLDSVYLTELAQHAQARMGVARCGMRACEPRMPSPVAISAPSPPPLPSAAAPAGPCRRPGAA